MIMLNVADYCHNCDQFSSASETNVFYGNGSILGRETTVFCKNQEKCKGIYDAIIKTIGKLQENRMGEWISVRERMPVEKINPVTMDLQQVICFCDFGGDPKRTDVRTYCYGTPIGHKEAHFWHGPQNMDGVVTHWMYMPDPPKEG